MAAPFYTNTVWSGYIWSDASSESTISAVGIGDPLCVEGTVGLTDDWSGTAMLGWNIAQEKNASSADVAVPTGTGLTVSVTNPGGSPLRVQIQGPDGDRLASQRWCAPLEDFGAPVTIPWADFNTACWEGGDGDAYAMDELEAVMILVPGMGEEDAGAKDVDFDFCLDAIGEGTTTTLTEE